MLLNDEQWHKLMEINRFMSDDFQMRRELLLTRLDVTIQSFKWADRLKECNNEISNIYNQKRKELQPKQTIKIYEIIAARDG
jgi:protein FAM98B